jgi:hypothetical protein
MHRCTRFSFFKRSMVAVVEESSAICTNPTRSGPALTG